MYTWNLSGNMHKKYWFLTKKGTEYWETEKEERDFSLYTLFYVLNFIK